MDRSSIGAGPTQHFDTSASTAAPQRASLTARYDVHRDALERMPPVRSAIRWDSATVLLIAGPDWLSDTQ